MARIALTLLLVSLAVSIQGAPGSIDSIIEAAKSGNLDQIQDLFSNFGTNTEWKPISDDTIPLNANFADLKPSTGERIFGHDQTSVQTFTTTNGHKTQDSSGHSIINDNGKVKEIDFIP